MSRVERMVQHNYIFSHGEKSKRIGTADNDMGEFMFFFFLLDMGKISSGNAS